MIQPIKRLMSAFGWPELILLLVSLVYLVTSIVWTVIDTRLEYGDSAKHLLAAAHYFDRIGNGALASPLFDWKVYPPASHMVGVISFTVAGVSADSAIIGLNLVFVPLLVIGCYGAGRAAYGRDVGVLAGIYVLAVPGLMILFHTFLIDAPLAAMTAVSLWLLLACKRFSMVFLSAAAGVAIAVGLLIKPVFIFFVAGFIIMALARGGWRNYRGALICALAIFLIASPWYIVHYSDILGLTEGVLVEGNYFPTIISPVRWSFDNLFWYSWDLLNNYLYAPLAILTAIGTLVLGTHYLRSRDSNDYTPEIVFGLVIAYMGITYITLDDSRYSAPLIAYMALLGAGCASLVGARARISLGVVLVGLFVFNGLAINVGISRTVSFAVPFLKQEPHPTIKGRVLITSDRGFYEPFGPSAIGDPQPSSETKVLDIIESAKRLGVKRVIAEGFEWNIFSAPSVIFLARTQTIDVKPEYKPKYVNIPSIILLRREVLAGDPAPCTRLVDGTGIYVIKGTAENPANTPTRQLQIWCPNK